MPYQSGQRTPESRSTNRALNCSRLLTVVVRQLDWIEFNSLSQREFNPIHFLMMTQFQGNSMDWAQWIATSTLARLEMKADLEIVSSSTSINDDQQRCYYNRAWDCKLHYVNQINDLLPWGRMLNKLSLHPSKPRKRRNGLGSSAKRWSCKNTLYSSKKKTTNSFSFLPIPSNGYWTEIGHHIKK